MSKEHIRITLRIPPELHEKLSDSADEGTRSLNSEIVKRLEESFGDAPVQESAEELIRRVVNSELAKKGIK